MRLVNFNLSVARDLVLGHSHSNFLVAKMSATPPLPSSPPPRDEDASMDEIDALSGSEKFKAVQRKLSNSSLMYSSAPTTPRSPSGSPPAPPPKRQHVDDEKMASENAKRLTHATRDRPRRKVRLPSREMRRESLETPVSSPLPKDIEEEEEEGLDLPPPPPPPDSTPPDVPSSPPSSGKPCLAENVCFSGSIWRK